MGTLDRNGLVVVVVVVLARDLRRWNVYDHKHTTTMHQSLRLVYMGQCLCTDSHSLPFVMQIASMRLMQQIPDSMPPETSTEHTSPFCARTKKNTSGFESTQRRNCVQFVASRTDAEHVFTVEPSIAPQRKAASPEKSSTCAPRAIPRHREQDCQIRDHDEKRHHVSKCELREREMQEIHPEATVD